MSSPSETDQEQSAESDTAVSAEISAGEDLAASGTPAETDDVEDDLDDLEFLLEEIENRIAPLA